MSFDVQLSIHLVETEFFASSHLATRKGRQNLGFFPFQFTSNRKPTVGAGDPRPFQFIAHFVGAGSPRP